MATRSTIKVEGIKFAKICKHFDGYPAGMLERLENFNKKFTESRGRDDPEYKFAQLLRRSIEIWNDDDDEDTSSYKYIGYGVVEFDEDCGQEYEYILHNDGSVSYK